MNPIEQPDGDEARDAMAAPRRVPFFILRRAGEAPNERDTLGQSSRVGRRECRHIQSWAGPGFMTNPTPRPAL